MRNLAVIRNFFNAFRPAHRARWQVAVRGWMCALALSWLPIAALADTFTTTGSLATGRELHTATLLPNGRVLVTGGFGSSGFLSSAELYDPAAGSWTTTGSMAAARGYHTATLLANGKVLITGGAASSGYLRSAELYDPAAGSWATTGNLAAARGYHTATLLPNGKVLV